jgi:hypothetical protein
MALAGCGAKKEASSQAAIENTKTMASVDEKVNYLVGQTKAFINSKEFDQAVATASYILRNLDGNSQEAKNLLEKAKNEMTAQAKKGMEDVKKQLSAFGK